MDRDGAPDRDRRVEHAWALVPMKRFDQGKSRLGDALSPEARADLARSMFDRVVGGVLGSLVKSGDLKGVLVITDGADVATRAHEQGARFVIAPGVAPDRKLSAIVDEGLVELTAIGARAAIVIMGDLPKVDPDDVRALTTLLATHDIVLAPDAAGTGTNALATRLPAPMRTQFCGGESLADHVWEAERSGLRFTLCEREGLRFDVDQAADLAKLSPQ